MLRSILILITFFSVVYAQSVTDKHQKSNTEKLILKEKQLTTSISKMKMFRTTRAAFDQISQELARVQVGIDEAFTINPPNTTQKDRVVMSFFSITSVHNQSGKFFVEYILEPSTKGYWNLLRRVTTPGADGVFGNVDDKKFIGILIPFIKGINKKNAPNIAVDVFEFIGENLVSMPVNALFQRRDYKRLSSGIRITVEVTDRKKLAMRTISRVFFVKQH